MNSISSHRGVALPSHRHGCRATAARLGLLTLAVLSATPPLVTTGVGAAQALRSQSLQAPAPVQQDALRRQVEASIARGDAEVAGGNNRAAIPVFYQGLTLARQLGDGSLVARSLWKLAAVLTLTHGEAGRALQYANEAVSAARLAGSKLDEAWALDQVGNAYWALGDYEKALANFQTALALMRELSDRFGEATALQDTGITYRFLGQYDQALQFQQEAVDLFRQLNLRGFVSSALSNLGAVYSSFGEESLALDAYQQAVDLARVDQKPGPLAAALVRRANLNLDLGQYQLALSDFTQARAIRPEQHSPSSSWVLRGVGFALLGLGDVDGAVKAVRQSLALDLQARDEPGLANDYWALGLIFVERDPVKAIPYFQRALAVGQEQALGLSPSWGVYAGLAQAFRRQGDLDRAIENYYRAIERLESLRGQLASDQYRAAFVGKHHRIYEELVDTLMERYGRVPEARDDLRAFAVFERSKARAMVEGIAQGRLNVGQELAPDLQQQEQRLSGRIAELQRRLLEPALARGARQQIWHDLDRGEQDLDQLIANIKQRNPRYAALLYPNPVSVDQVHRLLDQSTALVAYLLTEDSMFAFVVTANTFRAERLAARPAAVTARVGSYVDLLARSDGAAWPAIGRRLYSDLVAPVRQYLPRGINRLIIVPDDVLHYLPFEALLVDDPADAPQTSVARLPSPNASRRRAVPQRYLLEDFAISYVPSATVLAQLSAPDATPAPAGRADLLLFANPAPLSTPTTGNTLRRQSAAGAARAFYENEGLELTPIPSSAAEAKVVAGYAGQGAVVYVDAEATERRVKTAPLDRFRVVHFATHGLISQRAPGRSALMLARAAGEPEDGFLQAREIYHLKLNSDLVVLSACQTALGRMLAGEGIQGLARAFLYAGARTVLASLWNVNDERAVTFMAAFYRHLADGQSKADALRAAKLDLLRQGYTAAPRYWAGFILIGEAQASVPFGGPPWWNRPSRWLVGGLALFLAGLSMFALVKKKGPAKRR